MREHLQKLLALLEERHRALEAVTGAALIGAGVAGVAGPFWALIVGGGLLLADVVIGELQAKRPRGTAP